MIGRFDDVFDALRYVVKDHNVELKISLLVLFKDKRSTNSERHWRS